MDNSQKITNKGLSQIITIEKHSIFLHDKYGADSKYFWPLGISAAKEVLKSFKYFTGGTVQDYFDNCGLLISGMINSFYITDDLPEELEWYLQETEPEFRQPSVWRAENLEDFFDEKNIPTGDIKVDDIQRRKKNFQEELARDFEDWTLPEVFLSALFYVFFSIKDSILLGTLDFVKIDTSSFLEDSSLSTKLQQGPLSPKDLKEIGLDFSWHDLKLFGEENPFKDFYEDIVSSFYLNPNLYRVFEKNLNPLFVESLMLWKVLEKEVSENYDQNFVFNVFHECIQKLWLPDSFTIRTSSLDPDHDFWFNESSPHSLEYSKNFQEFRTQALCFVLKNLLGKKMQDEFQNITKEQQEDICKNKEKFEAFFQTYEPAVNTSESKNKNK